MVHTLKPDHLCVPGTYSCSLQCWWLLCYGYIVHVTESQAMNLTAFHVSMRTESCWPDGGQTDPDFRPIHGEFMNQNSSLFWVINVVFRFCVSSKMMINKAVVWICLYLQCKCLKVDSNLNCFVTIAAFPLIFLLPNVPVCLWCFFPQEYLTARGWCQYSTDTSPFAQNRNVTKCVDHQDGTPLKHH